VVEAFRQLHKRQEVHINHYDPCVYYNKLPGGEYTYLLLYVDNVLIAPRSRPVIDKLKKYLSFEFEIKDLGKAKKVSGMEIERDQKSDKVCLKGCLKKVVTPRSRGYRDVTATYIQRAKIP